MNTKITISLLTLLAFLSGCMERSVKSHDLHIERARNAVEIGWDSAIAQGLGDPYALEYCFMNSIEIREAANHEELDTVCNDPSKEPGFFNLEYDGCNYWANHTLNEGGYAARPGILVTPGLDGVIFERVVVHHLMHYGWSCAQNRKLDDLYDRDHADLRIWGEGAAEEIALDML